MKPFDVIVILEKQYEKGEIFACVLNTGDCYEVTLPNREVVMKLTTEVVIDNRKHKYRVWKIAKDTTDNNKTGDNSEFFVEMTSITNEGNVKST